jgi:uncharacterized protein YgiM (DUF1202 family)
MLRKPSLAFVLLAGAVAAAPAPTAPAAAPAATAAPAPAATQSGRVARTTDLRDKPANDGAMLRVVPANTVVEVAARQGGWYRVTVDGVQGWMRLSAVRFGAAVAATGAGGGASPLAFLQSGRSAVTTGSVTTGVRGLSEEGLQKAEPNHAAVAALDALAVSTEDARRYAAELPVAAISVDYVKPPDKKDERKSKRKAKDEGGGG